MSLGIIIAVPDEARDILHDASWEWEKLDVPIYKSKKHELYLGVSGVGKTFASYTMTLLSLYCDNFINMGTSGGLGFQTPGDVYMCNAFVEHDMDVSGIGIPKGVTPYSGLSEALIETEYDHNLFSKTVEFLADEKIKYTRGVSLSGDSFLTNPEEAAIKRDLFKGEIVDMESAALAKLSRLRLAAKFFAVRYITDNANHDAANDWHQHVTRSSLIFNKLLHHLVEE